MTVPVRSNLPFQVSSLSLLLLAQAIFILTIAGSVALAPTGVTADLGLSVFGTMDITFLPFSSGLVLTSLCLLGTSLALPANHHTQVPKLLLTLIAIFTIAIVLTPYTLSPLVGQIHRYIGMGLFATEFILAVSFVVHEHDHAKPGDWLLLGLLPVGALAATLTFPSGHGYSFVGQLVFQLSFAVLALRGLKHVWR